MEVDPSTHEMNLLVSRVGHRATNIYEEGPLTPKRTFYVVFGKVIRRVKN